MEQYIPKSALVAEIQRYKHKADERLKMKNRTLSDNMKDLALQNLCGNLLHFINTFEVKEVDLEKELDSFAYSLPHSAMGSGSHLKHFDDPRVIEARNGGWTHSWKYDEIKKNSQAFL